MKIADYLVSGLRGIAAAAFLSCASAFPVYAVRDYDIHPERREARALENIVLILDDLCETYKADAQGIQCLHDWGRNDVYRWEEIREITTCNERYFTIRGKYDEAIFWNKNSRQCQELVEALGIYIEERKK